MCPPSFARVYDERVYGCMWVRMGVCARDCVCQCVGPGCAFSSGWFKLGSDVPPLCAPGCVLPSCHVRVCVCECRKSAATVQVGNELGPISHLS